MRSFYIANTEVVPAKGGVLIEGIIGSPQFINPIYSETNDADRDLVELIFSGLLKYSHEGNLVPDLARDFTIKEEGRVVEVDLKENVKWHDGNAFTADDVIFTIETIQDPESKSPVRANWIGVEVKKISDFKVSFELKEPYAPFLDRLTLKIIPSHIWKNVSPESLALSWAYNLIFPVGTGPYQMTSVKQEKTDAGVRIKEIQLQEYPGYHGKKPFIPTLVFKFYDSQEALRIGARNKEIQSFTLNPIEIVTFNDQSFLSYTFPFSRYFALFFNLDPPEGKEFIKEKEIRQALSKIIDRKKIIERVFQGNGILVYSPLRPDIYGFSEPETSLEPDHEEALKLLETKGYVKENGKIVKTPPPSSGELEKDLERGDQGEDVRNLQECLARDPEVYPEKTVSGIFGPATFRAVVRFQEKYAQDTLEPLGLTKGTGKVGKLTRKKLNEICFTQPKEPLPLTFTLATLNLSPLKEVAQELQSQLEAFGLTLNLETYDPPTLEREIIKKRAYELLLFGEILGKTPDPFPFWHSSQKRDPGLNLSSYENKKVDILLEEARREMDPQVRSKKYEEVQKLLLEDVPAIVLYNTDYTYFVSKTIKGVNTHLISDPSQRFAGISEWYMKTKRVFR